MLLSGLVIVFVWLMQTYRKTAFYSLSVSSVLIFVFADKESLNLFFIAKVLSVIFPIVLFAYLQGFEQKVDGNQLNDWNYGISNHCKYIRSSNYSLSYSDLPVFLMGLCLVLSMPNFEMNENDLIGFKDPIWCFSYIYFDFRLHKI